MYEPPQSELVKSKVPNGCCPCCNEIVPLWYIAKPRLTPNRFCCKQCKVKLKFDYGVFIYLVFQMFAFLLGALSAIIGMVLSFIITNAETGRSGTY